MKKVLFVHHSHTDIGYTERPQFVLDKQVKYIKDVIKYLDSGKYPNFKWQCETFFIVDLFIQNASEMEIEKFIKYVKDGKIGLSAGILNMSEMVDNKIMGNYYEKMKNFEEKYSVKITSGMQADVNGYGEGYAEKMANCGVNNYLAFVHTHHGMFPDFKKHSAFKWKLSNDKVLNVFNGEHYMNGNAFGFSNNAFIEQGFNDKIYDREYFALDSKNWHELSKHRLDNYFDMLEDQGWEYDFTIQGIHGKFTDNSMPNPDIALRINEFNKLYSGEYFVQMCTLDDVFEHIDKLNNLETYTGSWPDWWNDGMGSAPAELKIFKNIQDKYSLLDRLSNEYKDIKNEIDRDLILYSEHTFGSFDSIHNPHNRFAHEQWAAKKWWLYNAMKNVDQLNFKIYKDLGDISESSDFITKFKLINPHDCNIKKLIRLPFKNEDIKFLTGNYRIILDGKEIEYQMDDLKVPYIFLDMGDISVSIIEVEIFTKAVKFTNWNHGFGRYSLTGSDLVTDVNNSIHHKIDLASVIKNGNTIYTPFYNIEFNSRGITSFYDKKSNVELVTSETIFNPIYEVSKDATRVQIGRNRKDVNVETDYGKLKSVKIENDNKFDVDIIFEHEVNGTQRFDLIMNVSKLDRNVTLKYKIDKELCSDPESLYINLGINQKEDEVLFGRNNKLIEPWNNQIPGTLTDFYPTHEGIIVNKKEMSYLITTPDTQLIYTGDMKHKNRILFGDPTLDFEKMNLNIWLMNNIWETNFILNLAGYYEFEFVLISTQNTNHLDILKASNEGILIFPVE